jgi:hypothetical protein
MSVPLNCVFMFQLIGIVGGQICIQALDCPDKCRYINLA